MLDQLGGVISLKTALVVLCLVTLAGTHRALAFDQAAAQQACGNDVYALCQKAVPDHKKITACMQRHLKQVSTPCRRFMAASDAEMRRGR
jgi:hypothetical protein